MTIRLILGFFLAYLLAIWGTPVARAAALRFGVVDRPDGRLKNHREPVPYLGGLAVFGAFLLSIGMTFEFDEDLLALLLASTIVATVGLIDDFGALTPKPKALGQVVAVFVLLKSGIMVQVALLPWWARVVLTVVWLVGLSNAFNLADIMDGLASGLGVIAAAFLLVVAVANEKWMVAAFTVALIGALLGFLRFNFQPATIYLGDCGSLFIGLTLVALAMVMDYTAVNPLGWLAPLYILAVPIVDTLYVIVLRLRAGRKWGALATIVAATLLFVDLVEDGYARLSPRQSGKQVAGIIARELTPAARLYSVGIYDQTVPFYLKRTVTLVAYLDEFSTGIRHEPHLAIPTLEAFAADWVRPGEAMAIIHPDIHEKLATQGLAMTLLHRDERRILVRKP